MMAICTNINRKTIIHENSIEMTKKVVYIYDIKCIHIYLNTVFSK